MTPKEVLALAKAKDIKIVDLKFCDIHGTWQHFAIPTNELTEGIFTDGLGFDGSSIRGWKGIEASDMLVLPDPDTAFVDPFAKYATLSLICDVEDPLTREPYDRSPRGIARRAEAYLKTTDYGDTCYCGPEAEFFIFDDVRFNSASNTTSYSVDSNEGIWNTGKEEFPSLGYKIRHKDYKNMTAQVLFMAMPVGAEGASEAATTYEEMAIHDVELVRSLLLLHEELDSDFENRMTVPFKSMTLGPDFFGRIFRSILVREEYPDMFKHTNLYNSNYEAGERGVVVTGMP